MLVLIFISAVFLAFSNGANDNFKGVATLFGSGTTDFKKAINWATLTTFLGSIVSIFFASALIKNFSGKGLVPDELLLTAEFAIAITMGAALTVMIATKVGMPVSTTHGLVGALTGVGLLAVGSEFNFSKLGASFFLPLIVSPFLSAGLSLLFYVFFKQLKKGINISEEINQEDGSQTYNGTVAGIPAQKAVNTAHFISAGAVSFARGFNDTPKMVGLLLLIQSLDVRLGGLIIAIAIALGGILNAKKVGETMSKKITKMNHGQGFTANLVTSLLVSTASINGLPVSTTHVSVGSLFGIGIVTKQINLKVLSGILLSWVLTLPVAAVISSIIYLLLKTI